MVYTIAVKTPYLTRTVREIRLTKESTTVTLGYTDAETDELSFMETFSSPILSEVEKNLNESNYSVEQVSEIITGLKTLPEYTSG